VGAVVVGPAPRSLQSAPGGGRRDGECDVKRPGARRPGWSSSTRGHARHRHRDRRYRQATVGPGDRWGPGPLCRPPSGFCRRLGAGSNEPGKQRAREQRAGSNEPGSNEPGKQRRRAGTAPGAGARRPEPRSQVSAVCPGHHVVEMKTWGLDDGHGPRSGAVARHAPEASRATVHLRRPRPRGWLAAVEGYPSSPGGEHGPRAPVEVATASICRPPRARGGKGAGTAMSARAGQGESRGGGRVLAHRPPQGVPAYDADVGWGPPVSAMGTGPFQRGVNVAYRCDLRWRSTEARTSPHPSPDVAPRCSSAPTRYQ